MKMQHKKYIILLIFLMISGLNFTQLALNRGDKIISSNKSPVIVNTAQLTEISPITISQNSDWGALSGNSWFQGSGTLLDPYIISNITINNDMEMTTKSYCILINNTDVSFVIQGCVLSLRTYGSGGFYSAGIFLQNVEKGLIYNNEFHNYFDKACIRVFDCFNVSIVKNNANDAFYGFSILSSYNINTSGNSITDCFESISLSHCNYSSFYNNEIRLTENYPKISPGSDYYNYGITLYYSNFNNISENHFYCIPNPLNLYESEGNVIENNYFYSCVFYNPKTVLTIELLISSISMVSLIIPLYVITHKYPRRKKLVGIVSTAITLGIMGLLAHGAYILNLLGGWYTILYGVALIPLIGANLIILILSIRLIRKSRTTPRKNKRPRKSKLGTPP